MPKSDNCGRGRPKPNLDWIAIEAAVRGGASFASLEKLFPVSRQWISKQAKANGWLQGRDIVTPCNGKALPIMDWLNDQRFASLEPGTISIIYSLISEGIPEKTALKYCGIPESTWHDYRSKHNDMDVQVHAAKAGAIISRFKQVDKAAELGDWRAAEKLLTLNPETREDFSESTNAGTTITVHLSIPRHENVIEGEAIEVMVSAKRITCDNE